MKRVLTPTNNQRGVAAPMVAVGLTVIIGFVGFVADLGHAYVVQRTLQASADAAALAGAQDLTGDQTVATATARSYSAIAGSKNARNSQTVTMVGGYPKLLCLKSTGVDCAGNSGANAIQVRQQATVPMMFAQVLGVPSMVVSATSTAGISGGFAKPLNVMLVLDTTASMNTVDASCSVAGATREVCAQAGVRTLLNTLSPSVDKIGLMAFPGLSSTSKYSCSGTPKTVAYNKSPVYQLVPLSSDYRSTDSSKVLSSSSTLVEAAGDVSGCAGIQAPGGYGTYYSDAITTAQASLVSNGTPNAQNVIILLSDGDAGASSGNVPAGKATNQCHQAITAAKAAAAAGTWVYAIAYGSPTGATPSSCSTDTASPISACATMQQIASDSTKFYSDTGGAKNGCISSAHSISELVSLLQSVAVSLLPPRLLPNGTT